MKSKQSRSKTQVRFEKRAIKKLRSAGLYSGKVDLRKKLTAYQKRLIEKFDAVVRDKATVVKPKNAASFKDIFQVSGDKVVVPKSKGQKISVSKTGSIRIEGKTGNVKYVRTSRRVKEIGELQPTQRATKETVVAIPFARRVGKDQYRLEWHRFPTFKHLQDFMSSDSLKGYKDWSNYVFIEEITEQSIPDRNAELTRRAIETGKAKAENFVASSTVPLLGRTKRRRRKKNVPHGRG